MHDQDEQDLRKITADALFGETIVFFSGFFAHLDDFWLRFTELHHISGI
jgi:hypothetical protein